MRRTLVLCLAVVSAPALVTSCIGAGEIVDLVGGDASVGGDTGSGGSDGASSMDGATTGDGASGDGQDAVAFDGNDGGPGMVTAKVTTAAGPEPGVTVFFSGADGSLLSTATTDTGGQATATLPAGAMVTAIVGPQGNFQLLTYMGVEPGDVLPFVDMTAPTPNFSFKVTAVPTSKIPDDGGAPDSYEIFDPCTSGSGFAPTSLPAGTCGWSGPFPVLVLGVDSNYLGGFVYSKTATNPSDGGTLSLNLDQPWIPVASDPVSLTNVGDSVPNPDQAAYADGYALLANTTAAGFTSDVDAGTASVTFQGYPGFADFVETEVVSNSGSVLAVRNDTVPASVSFDVSQMLPAILAGGIDNITNPARPSAAWTPASSLASADGTYVSFELGNATWTFVVPPGATTLTAPELPSIDGGPSLTTGGGNLYDEVFATVDLQGIGGYAAFRQLGTTLFPNPNGAQLAPPLPAAGQLYRATVYAP